MRHRTSVATVVTVVLAGVAANCGGHTTGTTNTATGPSTTVLHLSIDGPQAVAPGQTVQFTATASLSNGTTADYTRKAFWSASPGSVLTITYGTGQATGQSVGDVTIQANVYGTGAAGQAAITRTVLPPNTYRLTGTVGESGLPVQGATIAVLSGTGAGLSTSTDGGGAYRLYGVAGAIQVKFSKPGYNDIVKAFTATQNDVLDFPEATQSAAVPSIAGQYTLTLTADPACPTVAMNHIAPLPDDFRQPRSYAASLIQNGPSLSVTLTGPQVVTGQNQFTGRVEPDSIQFQIGSYDYYYGSYGLNGAVAERLSATQEFEFGGQVAAQRSGSRIVGQLNGTLQIVTLPGAVSAQCMASNNQVTLTPAAQPSRHR
jgi:hypothetical protein